ncbi:MAG: AAA family ATPase, partial [Zestosphaera sp.]
MNKCSCKLVVAVSGMPGSGKSTLAKKIAEWLGLRMVSAGSLFRSLAT